MVYKTKPVTMSETIMVIWEFFLGINWICKDAGILGIMLTLSGTLSYDMAAFLTGVGFLLIFLGGAFARWGELKEESRTTLYYDLLNKG